MKTRNRDQLRWESSYCTLAGLQLEIVVSNTKLRIIHENSVMLWILAYLLYLYEIFQTIDWIECVMCI